MSSKLLQALSDRLARSVQREGGPNGNIGTQWTWALSRQLAGHHTRSCACLMDAMAQAEYEQGNTGAAVRIAVRSSTHKYRSRLCKQLWQDGHLLEAAQLLHVRGYHMSSRFKCAFAIHCAQTGHTAEAVHVLRDHASTIGTDAVLDIVSGLIAQLPMGTWVDLSLVYFLIPGSERDRIVTDLVTHWAHNGNMMDAVMVAQSVRMPTTAALSFAQTIDDHHPRWARLIVSKHLERINH